MLKFPLTFMCHGTSKKSSVCSYGQEVSSRGVLSPSDQAETKQFKGHCATIEIRRNC